MLCTFVIHYININKIHYTAQLEFDENVLAMEFEIFERFGLTKCHHSANTSHTGRVAY